MSGKYHPEATIHRHKVAGRIGSVGVWMADRDAVAMLLNAFGYPSIPPKLVGVISKTHVLKMG